jgi:hypothetical protein
MLESEFKTLDKKPTSQPQARAHKHPPTATMDPAALMRSSVARSRAEKQSRKALVLSNVAAISALL